MLAVRAALGLLILADLCCGALARHTLLAATNSTLGLVARKPDQRQAFAKLLALDSLVLSLVLFDSILEAIVRLLHGANPLGVAIQQHEFVRLCAHAARTL